MDALVLTAAVAGALVAIEAMGLVHHGLGAWCWHLFTLAAAGAVGAGLAKAAEFSPLRRTRQLLATFQKLETSESIQVGSSIDAYNKMYSEGDAASRNEGYKAVVDTYYNLVTQFYEWGWGRSFHFAYRLLGESFSESIRRHEYYLTTYLGLRAGDKALDLGCGVGGPLGNIAHFTGADITGITINQHQVNRANLALQQAGLSQRCRVKQGDFHHLPFPDNHFDGVYAIEATCHSPRRQNVFGEAFRVLKPGQCFACYEWVTTEHYDAADPKQREAIQQILHGDGLPDMADMKTVKDALLEVGFELVAERDVAQDKGQAVSWYAPLEPSWNPLDFRFQFNPIGSIVLDAVLRLLEATGLAPAGTVRVQTMLQVAARGLVYGGRTNTFTPMYLLVGRKPVVPK